MTDKITVVLSKPEASVVEATLRDVELLAGADFVETIPTVAKLRDHLIDARTKISAALEEGNRKYTIEFHDGERWRWISKRNRFWERRRFDSKDEAEMMIILCKREAPSWFKYRILEV